VTKPGKLFCVAAFAVALAAAGAVFAVRSAHAPRLPERAHSTSLPPAFDSALAAARLKVTDGGFSPADVRELAHLYQANRLNAEARACYALLRKSPAGLSAEDHYYLSDIAQFEGDLDSAAPELRQVIALQPQYLPAHLQLADALFKSGKPAEAGKEYEAILVLVPNQPQAMFSLARTDIQKGDDAKAIERLEALLTVHPEMTSAAALLAQVFDRHGEKEKATLMGQWARQKPEPVPEDPWMDALLGYSYDIQRLSLKFEEYLTSGEIEHALPLLSRVEELDPKSPIPQLLRGWSQARDHNDAQAVKEYRMALDKGGDPERICPYMVQSLMALGRVDDAEKLLAEFYAKKPESVPILIAYSDVAVKRGDNARAKELLRKVLLKEPYRFAANMNLAKILWAAGEKEEAAACLERAAKVSSSDIPSRALLGEYYLGKSEPLLAIPPLEQAVGQAQPGTAGGASLRSMLYAAYMAAGSAAEAGARPADAPGFFEKAILLAPSSPGAYARKAAASAAVRDFQGAAGALRRLAQMQPGNPTIHLSLGDVIYQMGDAVQARQEWQKAMDLTSAANEALRSALSARLTGPITEDTFR